MKRIKRKVKKKAKEAYYNLLFKTVYIAGLTILIPMVFAFATDGASWYSSPRNYLIAAVFLICTAFIGLLGRLKKYSETFKAMGKMTLIPGFIALFVFIFGKSIFYILFGELGGYIDTFITNSIPNMGILLIGYLGIGGILYYIGTRIKK